MGFFSGLKKVTGHIVDVRVDKWMSLGFMKETFTQLKGVVEDLFIAQKASRTETFEQAMERLELTEDDLKQRKKEFTRLCAFFLVVAFSILVYGIFRAYHGHLIAALISLCICLYTLSQAFKFHFWLFQINHRKLGCTIDEWLHSKVTAQQAPVKTQADPTYQEKEASQDTVPRDEPNP